MQPNENVVSDPLEILSRGLNMFRSLADFYREAWLQRLRNYEFVAGKQWQKVDYDWLINNRRSADVYNFILPIILALSGTQKKNRQNVRAYPVGGGDEETAKVITDVIRWGFQQCDKDFQFSRAFMDMVIGRTGWMKTYWSTEWNVEGLPYCEWHDPFRIMVDPDTQGDFHRTCNYLWDTPWLTGEQILNAYAASNPDLREAMQEQIDILEGNYASAKKSTTSWRDKLTLGANLVLTAFSRDRALSDTMETEFADTRNGMYRVLELHERRWERHKYFMHTGNGNTLLVPASIQDNREAIGGVLQNHPELTVYDKLEAVTFISTLIPAFSSNPVAAVPQDKPYDIQNNMYMYTPINGYDFHPDGTELRSVVDSLIDPQQAYNKLESTLKDFIVRTVGHGYIYQDGAIDPDDMASWESKELGAMRKYAKNATAPQPDMPGQLSREVVMGKADHRDTMRTISGVPLNLQGQSDTANEPAALFSARVEQAGLMQTTLLDSARRADRILGKQMADTAQHYMKEERYLRLVDDNTGDAMQLVVNQQTVAGIKNDITRGTYDTEIDQTSYSISARQQGFMQGIYLAKVMPGELIPWATIIQNSDIPNKRDWITFIQQRMGIIQAGGPAAVGAVSPLIRALAGGGAAPPVMGSEQPRPDSVSLAS